MSVVTMVRLVRERQEQEEVAKGNLEVRRGRANGVGSAEVKQENEEEEAKHAVTTALERLTGFIPTEVVAGWGAAVGLLAPREPFAAWAIFATAVLFLVCLILMETVIRDKNAKRSKSSSMTIPARRTFLMVVVAVLAFVVWAFATPGSPAEKQWGGNGRYNALFRSRSYRRFRSLVQTDSVAGIGTG